MNNKALEKWEQMVNPEILRPRLVAAALFIAAYEALKDSIIERIKSFFIDGFKDGKRIIGEDYAKKVLSLHKDNKVLPASLAWLEKMKAIDNDDRLAFDRVTECRNHLAHSLFKMVAGEQPEPDLAVRFSELQALLRKVEVWWIVNVELPTDPDFDDKEVIENEILPGPVMALQILLDVALGTDDQAKSYMALLKAQASAAANTRAI